MLLECVAEFRRNLVAKVFNRYYSDLQDYILYEPNWTHTHNGLVLSFPYDRERLFIVVDGAPIGVQEGNGWQVNTKRYQFSSACELAKQGVDVYCVHNHPGGDPTPSEMDLRIAEHFPEIRYYTVGIDNEGIVHKRLYNKDGIISNGECRGLLNESNV